MTPVFFEERAVGGRDDKQIDTDSVSKATTPSDFAALMVAPLEPITVALKPQVGTAARLNLPPPRAKICLRRQQGPE
jgi:hypothetical protein